MIPYNLIWYGREEPRRDDVSKDDLWDNTRGVTKRWDGKQWVELEENDG